VSALGISHFALYCVTVLLLSITPGPDTAYIVGRSLAQGRMAGLMSALGISAGCCVHSLAASLGLTALLAASANAFLIVKWAGAIYLTYLGLRMLFVARRTPSVARAASPQGEGRSARRLFVEGFLTDVLNPKMALFFLAFFPQFVASSASHRTAGFLILSAVFVSLMTVLNCLTAWLAASLVRQVHAAPALRAWLERVVGVAFVGMGVRLALLTGAR